MRCHERLMLLCLFGCVLHMVMCGSDALAAPTSSAHAMKLDAELTDVCFVDADLGWAVGDRGVVWHTRDGGARWELMPVPATCRLESITFVNQTHGWIVGGWTHAYTHRTSAVILRTTDGGASWKPVEAATLPSLKHIHFFDTKRGWAVGNASAMYSTGIFQTIDGGRTWSPLPTGQGASWFAADFRTPHVGAVAGGDGRLGMILNKELRPTQTLSLGARALNDLKLERGIGWLVGERGLVMLSTDGGLHWQKPPGRLPPSIGNDCDLHTICTFGDHVWIAGSPGSIVLHTANRGETWDVYRTGQSLPLRSIHFNDERIGWTVGSLGTILTTRDGGKSWRAQRGGGTRVAMLGLFSEPSRVPYELIASAAGNDGYLTAIEAIVYRTSETNASLSPTRDRAQQAVVSAGGSAATTTSRFPVMQRGLRLKSDAILSGWDMMSDGRGLVSAEEHLVRKIRQWRPDVIVTEHGTPTDSLSQLMHQIVSTAVIKAADATSYPNQLTDLGLSAWQAKKVFLHTDSSATSSVSITTSQLAPTLGRSFAEQASASRGLVADQYSTPATTINLRQITSNLPSSVRRNDIFAGILLQPGGDARRVASQANGNLQALARAANKRRNMERLIENSNQADAVSAAWLGELQDLTSGMSYHSAGDVLHQLGVRYHRSGESEMAAEVFQRLTKRYPKHVLAEAATLWLVRYYSSREIAWQRRQAEEVQTVERTDDKGVQRASATEPLLRPRSELPRVAVGGQNGLKRWRQPTGNSTTLTNSLDDTSMALKVAEHIQSTQPALFADPRLRFPLAAAERRSGSTTQAAQFFRATAHAEASPWSQPAKNEMWLIRGKGTPSSSIHISYRAGAPPHLDGKLDDACWSNAKPLQLVSSLHNDAGWPASTLIAYDDRFLYIAASCRKVERAKYPTTNVPRPRDPSLENEDRVTFLIDVDRDYGSFYELTVDHRGWVSEACFGDRSWNPKWFVAAASDEAQWYVEAAIPLNALGPANTLTNQAWAIGAQRIVPEVGFQSWTKPAAVKPNPAGLGILLFK